VTQGRPADALALLQQALTDEDRKVRETAARALSRIRGTPSFS
jgi:HEAT repeat protein